MAAIAAAATIMPVGAEVQPGTSSLIETISSNGILVTINHEDCLTNEFIRTVSDGLVSNVKCVCVLDVL